jgi:hypothetical protein
MRSTLGFDRAAVGCGHHSHAPQDTKSSGTSKGQEWIRLVVTPAYSQRIGDASIRTHTLRARTKLRRDLNVQLRLGGAGDERNLITSHFARAK